LIFHNLKKYSFSRNKKIHLEYLLSWVETGALKTKDNSSQLDESDAKSIIIKYN
jgi:hypothetical protein